MERLPLPQPTQPSADESSHSFYEGEERRRDFDLSQVSTEDEEEAEDREERLLSADAESEEDVEGPGITYVDAYEDYESS